jgi:hypothetical protein
MASAVNRGSSVQHTVVCRSHHILTNQTVHAIATLRIKAPFAALNFTSQSECPLENIFFDPSPPASASTNSESVAIAAAIACLCDNSVTPPDQRIVPQEERDQITDVHATLALPPRIENKEVNAKWGGLAGAIGAFCNAYFRNLNHNNSTFIVTCGSDRVIRNDLFLTPAKFTELHPNPDNAN